MEYVLVFALSAVVAVLFNWGQPKLAAVSFFSTRQTYFWKTLVTTLVIFAAILVAGMAFMAFDKRVVV
jgi:hypothetical protein